MATSSDEILQAMIDTIEAKDESIDVRKGPFYDFVLAPVSDEIAPAYQEIADVSGMMSQLATGSADTMTSTFLDALGANMRVSKRAGRKSVCRVYFYFSTLPASDVSIPAGTSVATTDGKYIFTTDNAISGINSTTAINYYKSSTGRYEVPATVTATVEGSGYNVPANRLVYLPTSVDGIDGVYNPIAASEGQDAADAATYLSDIRARFAGMDSSSINGMKSSIVAKYDTDIAVNFIDGDSSLFLRPIQGKGLDIYVNTPSELYYEDLFVTGSSTTFPLTKPPALSIEQVTINGTTTTAWEFIKDTDITVQSSPKANDRVNVTGVTHGDIVRVTYTYDSITNWIQDNIISTESDDYFGIDGLARLATDTPIYIKCTLSVGTATSGLVDSLRLYLINYVTDNAYGTLDPTVIRSNIFDNFTNIRTFKFTVFGKSNVQNTTIKPIVSSGVEAFSLASNNVVITVA